MTVSQADIEKIILKILAENNSSIDKRLGQFEYYFSEEVFKRTQGLDTEIDEYKFNDIYIPALINLASNNLIFFNERNISNFNFSNVKIYLTEYGKKYVQDPDISPYDDGGYITYLKINVPNIDDIVESYLKESLNTIKTRSYLASVFTLGAASERLILLLRDEYCNVLGSNGYTGRQSRIAQEEQIKRIFNAIYADFQKIHNADRNYFGKDLWERIDQEIKHIFDFIRISRNDSGHPVKPRADIDQFLAHGNLINFIRYCIDIYKVINHLKNNPLPTGVSL